MSDSTPTPEQATTEPDLTARITAAVKDYRRVFPEPHTLAPNLALAVEARVENERLRHDLTAARATLAQAAALAEKLAAKAPEGDWGDTMADTVAADVARGFLAVLSAAPADRSASR